MSGHLLTSPSTPEGDTTLVPATVSDNSRSQYYNDRNEFLKDLNVPRASPISGSSLDASLKNNLKFTKKLRNVTSDALPTLLTELARLKLDKYLAESSSALLESLSSPNRLSPADSDAILSLTWAIHHRFGSQFTAPFIKQVIAAAPLKSLGNSREERDRITRCRNFVRFASDAFLSGLFLFTASNSQAGIASNSSDFFASSQLHLSTGQSAMATQERANNDFFAFVKEVMSDRGNLSLVSFLARYYAFWFFSELPHVYSTANSLVLPTFQSRLRELLVKYQSKLIAVCHKEVGNLTALKSKSTEWYYERGSEAPEDLKEQLEKQQILVDDLISTIHTVSEALGVEVPNFSIDQGNSSQNSSSAIIVHKHAMGAANDLVWEDEVEREFYSQVPSLELLLPPALFQAAKTLGAALTNALTSNDELSDDGDADTETHDRETSLPSPLLPSVDKVTPDSDEIAAQLVKLFERLQHLASAEEADALAIELCHFNTRSTQNRLIRALVQVEGRPDVIPYYGRLLAVLQPLGIGAAVAREVERQVRRFARSKNVRDVMGWRILWARYLAVLVKFNIARDAAVYFATKLLLDNPHSTNIEMLCHLLESCGRFLAAQTDSGARLADVVDRLGKLKRHTTDPRLRVMIASAILACQPGTTKGTIVPPKDRLPEDMFLAHLCSTLSPATSGSFVRTLLSFDWSSQVTISLITKYFVKLKAFKFSQLPIAAQVLSKLVQYYPALLVGVVDKVFERIKDGLELNTSQDNRSRLMTVNFCGHLFKSGALSTHDMFAILQLLIALPMSNQAADVFRIRLVCGLLDTCACTLPQDSLKYYLTFFQLYIASKGNLPIEVEFVVQDMLLSLPVGLQQRLSYNEAVEAAHCLIKSSQVTSDQEHLGPQPSNDTDNMDALEQCGGAAMPKVADPAKDALDFEQELALLMDEGHVPSSADVAKRLPVPQISKDVIDASLQRHSKGNTASGSFFVPGARHGQAVPKLAVVTKRGTKMVVKALPVPDGSALAQHAANIQAQEEHERLELKRKVLKYSG